MTRDPCSEFVSLVNYEGEIKLTGFIDQLVYGNIKYFVSLRITGIPLGKMRLVYFRRGKKKETRLRSKSHSDFGWGEYFVLPDSTPTFWSM